MKTTNILLSLLLLPLLTFGLANKTTSNHNAIPRTQSISNVTSSPVELASFKARVDDGHVQLAWVTLQEVNNDFFTVERSADGADFVAVGNVTGSGNTKTKTTYDFNNEHPLHGISYYRLKQTDYDGNYTYSKILLVVID